MSPTPRLKSSGLPRYNNLGQISWCWKSLFLKISNLLRFKTVSRFVICITLREKMFPTPPLKSSGLPRYNNLGQISWCWKIVIFKNFKFAPIQNGFEIRDLHHFARKNVPHTTSQILRVTEIQQFRSNQLMLKIVIFKNFKFAPIQNGFEIRDLHHFARKNVPHTTSQILRVTEYTTI